MKVAKLALAVLLALTPTQLRSDDATAPFVLHIVAKDITMSRNKPHVFYVVLTNVLRKPQTTWEYWNSWGYQNVWFEFTLPDGVKGEIRRKDQGFTRNGPSTFVVQPGEHQVYAIQFDERWVTHPAIRKADEMQIKLKAVFEAVPTAESNHFHVWTGRVESHSYDFLLRQW